MVATAARGRRERSDIVFIVGTFARLATTEAERPDGAIRPPPAMEVAMVCARLSKILMAGAVAGALAAGSAATARPLPVATAATIAGEAPVEQAGWRGYGYRHYGYRRSHGGAIFAGAALGILGLAAAASAANSGYYYGGYPYGYGYYPAYSYGYPAYYSYPRVRYYHYPRAHYYHPRVYHVRRVVYRPAYHRYWW